ncbi:pyruvate kinase [Pasteurella multocida]|nr:pyruvate kinase [Pasteurella multocida]
MKKFDLEKALAGEPILTRDHQKGYVKFTIEENSKIKKLVGIVHNGCLTEVEEWLPSGNILSDDITPNDIIGMWEELRPTVTLTLPCPLKTIKDGQRVYFLNQGNFLSPIGSIIFNEDRICDCQLFKNGGLFANRQDAQSWLDAMRDSRR